MREGEKYEHFFSRKGVGCCRRRPMPLFHIPIKVMKKKGYDSHDSHYYDYAFECLECGAVYEVIIEDYSYTSIGDFMSPNYTSWSVRPALRYIKNHPTLKQKLVSAEDYFKEIGALDKLIWKLKDKLDGKIDKLEKFTGRLDKEQTWCAKERLGKVELKKISGYKKQQEELKKLYIEKIREILGLPMASGEYKQNRIDRHSQEEELEKQLASKREQLSSIAELITKIESKDKLLMEIGEINMQIKDLRQ